MRPTRLIAAAAVACVAAVPCAAASAPAYSAFDGGGESWTLHTYAGAQPGPTSYANPTSVTMPGHDATGGQDGGYLRITDPNSDWSYFSAPASFLGDRSGLYGVGVLSFAQRWFNPHIEPAPFHHHVVLISGSTVLRSVPGAYPNDTWQTLQFPFAPAYWRFGTAANAPGATESQLRTALSNVTRLLIYAEFGNQVQEVVGLDSVRLALYGDANMNGRVGTGDLALADRGAALGLGGWANGDFNADGAVTAADYRLLLTTLQSHGSHTSAPTGLVPEPAAACLLAIGATALVARRGRRGARGGVLQPQMNTDRDKE